ncbi:hypothetical protein CMT37_17010 [Elizabethkingia anophelis]|nr:hypothetical protein [Elizabethkingia anophelis]
MLNYNFLLWQDLVADAVDVIHAGVVFLEDVALEPVELVLIALAAVVFVCNLFVMTKLAFRTPFNFLERIQDLVVESNSGISETAPEQSLTVRQILVKYSAGTLPDIYGEPEYSEDMPDLRGLDISELHEMRREARQDIEDINAEIKRQKEESRKKKEEEQQPPADADLNPSPTDVQPSNTQE